MTQKEIKIIRGKDGKVVAGQVTKTFRKRANIFGTPEYEKWEEFVTRSPKAKMVVKKIRPTYEKMINFINTQDNSEFYLKEIDRIKNMTAINGKSYNTIVKWFNNTFENTSAYQLVFKGILEEISEGKIQNIKAVNKNTAA